MLFLASTLQLCAVRSYASWSSYILRGYRLGQRLALHLRGLCSLFVNEINTKLTRLVTVFWLPTSLCWSKCSSPFSETSVRRWLLRSGACSQVLASFLDNITRLFWRYRVVAKNSNVTLFSWWHISLSGAFAWCEVNCFPCLVKCQLIRRWHSV